MAKSKVYRQWHIKVLGHDLGKRSKVPINEHWKGTV